MVCESLSKSKDAGLLRVQVNQADMASLTGKGLFTAGALPPQELFVQAIDILSGKADKLLEQI